MVEAYSSSEPPEDGVAPDRAPRSLYGELRAPRRDRGSGRRRDLPPDPPPERPAKPPKRRRSPLVAAMSGLLSFLGIAAIAGTLAWSVGLQRVNAPGPLAADKVVNVRPGNDVSVVDQLSDEGVIENRLLMTATLWLEGDRGAIKSGEYLFKQSASLRDVIDTLVSGRQVLHALTIPEGLTSEQVVDRVREDDVLIGDVSIAAGEGTLMPDTYKFARGTTRDQVIRSMQAEQRRVLSEVWSHRAADAVVRSPFELVTLASIVEKETGRADERPRVAGVFVNRLARSMPLQSDPTIVYGLVGGKGTLGHSLTRSEIDQRTPYNTYTNVGLPPGPIANPGRAALEAVANPSRTKDLYFVADGTGGHAFADSLDQHRQNVLRWRQIEKDRSGGGGDDDKVAPAGTVPAAPRSDLHGEIDVNMERDADLLADAAPTATGAAAPDAGGTTAVAQVLPASRLPTFAQANPATPPVVLASALSEIAKLTSGAAPRQPPRSGAEADASTFDELDIEVGGLRSRDAGGLGDGDDAFGGAAVSGGADPGGSAQTFPVSPQHLADQRARAIALGLLPSGSAAANPEETAAPDPAPGNAIHLYGKGKIIDASEGTSFDPLRDRTYDLTTAKDVPVIKGIPDVQPLTIQKVKAAGKTAPAP